MGIIQIDFTNDEGKTFSATFPDVEFSTWMHTVANTPPPRPSDPWLLSQRDPRWAGVPLNAESSDSRTIGKWGCLHTIFAMILRRAGEDATPLTVCTSLMQHKLIGHYGEILLRHLADISDIVFEGWEVRPLTNLDKFAHFEEHGYVALRVDATPHSAYNPTHDQHWVLAIDAVWDATGDNVTDIVVADPIDGTVDSLMARYGKRDIEASVLEAGYYMRGNNGE